MASRTTFLARLIGLYCLLAGLAMVARGALTIETVTAVLHDGPLLFFIGVVLLAAGLAIVLAHNVWSGGALPVVVTLIGWATLLKGWAFILLPPPTLADFYLGQLHYAQLYYLLAAFSVVIGLYLTIAGFRTPARG
jgi:hypothetical protein